MPFCSLSIRECFYQISRKIIKSTYLINSLENQPVILELTASAPLESKSELKTERNFIEFYNFITFLLIYSLWGFR